jgi:uncharacterized protein YndB with AHSA1/START domain
MVLGCKGCTGGVFVTAGGTGTEAAGRVTQIWPWQMLVVTWAWPTSASARHRARANNRFMFLTSTFLNYIHAWQAVALSQMSLADLAFR